SLSFLVDPAAPSLHTLSLHDALPICCRRRQGQEHAAFSWRPPYTPFLGAFFQVYTGRMYAIITTTGKDRPGVIAAVAKAAADEGDRKSTRLNSSHVSISYAVFCLKQK